MAQSYDIFMSYRHKPLDGEITQKTFAFLEKYRLPKALRDEGCRQIERVFRDTEELSVSRILTHTIDEALRSAEFVVIVCSTQTPESEWVDREVITFTEMGKADRIYPLLINGSPEQSFPRALKAIPDIMDRVMDVRCESDAPDAIMKKTRQAVLRVIAAFAGCSEDRLRREDSMRASKRILTRGAAAAAVFAGAAAVSACLWTAAVNYRQQAKEARDASMTILQELTYDLPSRMSDLPGTYSRLAEILQTNADQINEILELSGADEAAVCEIGANYDKLGTAYSMIGLVSESEQAYLRAIDVYSSISSDKDLAAVRLAEANNDLGCVLTKTGRYDEAASCFERAVEYQQSVSSGGAVLAQYLANSGANKLNAGDTAAGVAELETALASCEWQEWYNPENAALAYCRYGEGLRQLMRYEEAESALAAGIEIYSSVGQAAAIRAEKLSAQAELALCMNDTGRYSEAAELYSKLLPEAQELAQDGENVVFLSNLAQICNNYAQTLNLMGDMGAANEVYMQAADAYRRISELTGAPADIGYYAVICLNIADNAFTAGDYELSGLWFSRGLEAYSPVAEELGAYHQSMYLSYRAFDRLVFDDDLTGALADAKQALELYGSVLTYGYCGTMCLLAGETEYADELFAVLAENGAAEPVKQLFEALTAYGIYDPHMDLVLENIIG